MKKKEREKLQFDTMRQIGLILQDFAESARAKDWPREHILQELELTAKALTENKHRTSIIKVFLTDIFYFYTKNYLFQCFVLRRWIWVIIMDNINLI